MVAFEDRDDELGASETLALFVEQNLVASAIVLYVSVLELDSLRLGAGISLDDF